MTRVIGPTGSRRRRRILIAPILLAAALALFYTAGAQAVHSPPDSSFELDGNVADDPGNSLDDWANIFDNTDSSSFDTGIVTDPDGATIFTGAQPGGNSKDIDDITGWRHTSGSVPDKDELQHAYAAIYTSGSERRLYFGADREARNGSANLGVWFFHNTITLNPPPAGSSVGTFNGLHTAGTVPHSASQPGDIFVLSEFSQGGAISTIRVFEWVGSGGDQKGGTLNEIAKSVDCSVAVHTTTVDLCGLVNSANVDPPWTYTGKANPSDQMLPGAFYEGGVDLTALGFGSACFGSFLAETRTSPDVDSVLKDFVLHSFQPCGSTTVTTPKDGSGNPLSGDISIGNGLASASDTAKVTGSGGVGGAPVPTGKVKFYLCGPAASDAAAQCPAAPSTTGATQIGAAGGETLIPTGNPSEAAVTSPAATVSSVGHYCWRADYLGDGNYPADPTTGVASSDRSLTECFTVSPVTPPLDTAAVASPVAFGNPVQDNATLSGTATQPGSPIINGPAGPPAGGKIVFTLLKSDCSTLATGTGTNPQDFTPISGDGTYGPVSFTPDAPGTYHWKAQYIPAASDPNNLGSTHNGSCTDPDEAVIVQQIETQILTNQRIFPNDSATMTSAGPLSDVLPATGTVTFRLYGAGGGNSALVNCQAHGDTVGSGGLLYKETLTGQGGAHSFTSSTSNTSVAVSANATVFWRVTYATGDTAHTGRQSDCVENTVVSFTNDAGPGTLFP
jgi:hypothetical protein